MAFFIIGVIFYALGAKNVAGLSVEIGRFLTKWSISDLGGHIVDSVGFGCE